MDDPASGWGVADTDLTTIAYAGGVLSFVHKTDTGGAYSTRLFPSGQRTVLGAAQFTPAGSGGAGMLCHTADNTSYGALVTTDASLIFFSLTSEDLEVLERYNNVGLEVSESGATTLLVECATNAEGALRLMAASGSSGPLATYHGTQHPAPFTGLVAYSEAFAPGFSTQFAEIAAFAKATAAATSPAAAELLTHVLAAWQPTCIELPLTSSDVDAYLTCFIQSSGDGIDFALYQAPQDVPGAYQVVVDQYGTTATGDCATGPNESSWGRDEIDKGRLQCAPQQVGIRADWTNDELGILGTVIEFGGSYEELYTGWSNAASTP
jgi:hypothetical protein